MVLNTNNWDWRIYCGNRKCDFSIELKKENLQNYFDTKFGKQIYETSKQYDINIFSEKLFNLHFSSRSINRTNMMLIVFKFQSLY